MMGYRPQREKNIISLGLIIGLGSSVLGLIGVLNIFQNIILGTLGLYLMLSMYSIEEKRQSLGRTKK